MIQVKARKSKLCPSWSDPSQSVLTLTFCPVVGSFESAGVTTQKLTSC